MQGILLEVIPSHFDLLDFFGTNSVFFVLFVTAPRQHELTRIKTELAQAEDLVRAISLFFCKVFAYIFCLNVTAISSFFFEHHFFLLFYFFVFVLS